MAAIGCLIFAAIIWHKRKQVDIEVEHQNVQLLQEQEEIHKRNSELLQNQSKILQESASLEEIIKIKQIEQNELNELIEKLKDSRHQQIVVFEREQAKLEIINQQQDDAMMRLKATEEALETKQQSEQLLLRKAFEQYADNLDLEAANKEREYDELLKRLMQIYDENQMILAQQAETQQEELKLLFSRRRAELATELEIIQQELDKIRATKAAALEAQLREEEIKNKATFYTLQLSDADKTDISYLRSIEHNLREPRPLRMLIWTTFYRDKANDLAARVGAVGACGIYKLTHTESGISYIGQARNIKDRWMEHIKCSLGIDTPVTSQLYAFTREKGIENFTFEVLETCSQAELNEKERIYIDMYQTKDFGLNKTKGNK